MYFTISHRTPNRKNNWKPDLEHRLWAIISLLLLLLLDILFGLLQGRKTHLRLGLNVGIHCGGERSYPSYKNFKSFSDGFQRTVPSGQGDFNPPELPGRDPTELVRVAAQLQTHGALMAVLV